MSQFIRVLACRAWKLSISLVVSFGTVVSLTANDRKIDPTFVRREISTVKEKKSDLTTPGCHYRPLFGAGDQEASIAVGIARYGEVTLDPNGSCASVEYPEEDQVYVALAGSGAVNYGSENVVLRKEDYLYLPAGVMHSLVNRSSSPLRVIIMGFRTKGFDRTQPPSKPLRANINDVPTQTVAGHPSSTLYRLLMGDVDSKRDRIAAGHVLTSLFLMEIAPGGTNFPHHHQREEEIYLVLDGRGDMVAGGGIDGVEGRHPAKAGDAYFFRLNCTVGYYSAPGVKSRILAVRSWYPGMKVAGAEH
jgi:mannose-6-phosphate isomerase-like protein (cupin superfamily)